MLCEVEAIQQGHKVSVKSTSISPLAIVLKSPSNCVAGHKEQTDVRHLANSERKTRGFRWTVNWYYKHLLRAR
jgi:hypothetical protein